ncbi:uncharacterized protein I206_106473 [Kwoniella pini CBS 10737]|uniref:Uncharacterized protein n=1 Tax=Kwoniella pini CBS 10737 TaxID=1296096 RepID=A0A1B9HUE5_9TREE|nr:uncharacterized protein I206_07278 [Kwoniella pini CBS 10737]OCF46891.1 hypothetical protein I206_07278 [Kwoniella pini CBS 10737]
MPPRRSSRTSISPITGADDVSSLTLAEVRDRLNRNNILLESPLFGGSPNKNQISPSIGMNIGIGEPGPSSMSFSPSPNKIQNYQINQNIDDPVRNKLLLARESLLAREQELMMNNLNMSPKIEIDEQHINGNGEESGKISFMENQNQQQSQGRSGKARVLNRIREDEHNLARNGLILPIDQTLHLGQRDYQNATAQQLSYLSINQTRSSSPKPRQLKQFNNNPNDLFNEGGDDDEMIRANRLARLNAFMSYKQSNDSEEEEEYDEDEDEINDEDRKMLENLKNNHNSLRNGNGNNEEEEEDERNFTLSGISSGGYDGNGIPERMIDSIGEEIDEFGEDDEIFAEGNDEYDNGLGQGSLAAGPGR